MKKLKAVLSHKSRKNIIDSNAETLSAPTRGPAQSPSRGSERSELFPDGIKVLHDCEDAVVDVCFLHGLTGNRESTWTAEGQSQPWLQTLLPTRLHGARILTYGYDAYVTPRRGNVASSNRLLDHAINFLNDLSTNRAACNCATRPLIFVAHGLGGLVCKEMLLASRSPTEPHLRNVFEATEGIIFMGTPHTGSWMADWASLPAKTLGIFKSTNQSLLQVLRSSDQYLESVQQRFLAMTRGTLQSDRAKAVRITCFYEELPLLLVGKVVSKESASFPGYNLVSIHANHCNMVRFSNEAETGFQRLLGELRRWVAEIRVSSMIATEQNPAVSGSSVEPTKEGVSPASLVGLHHGEVKLVSELGETPDDSSKLPLTWRSRTTRSCLEMGAELFGLEKDDRSLLAVDGCLTALELHHRMAEMHAFSISEMAAPYPRDVIRLRREREDFRMMLEDVETNCLNALSFPEMQAREMNIDPPARDTCQWIYNTPAYSSWSSRSTSLLWIKGKPGAGKSTLMRSVCARRSMVKKTDVILLSFFFNGHGAILEKSPMGLYLTLLRSLLHQSRLLFCEFLPVWLQKHPLNFKGGVSWSWNEIQTIFHSLIEQKLSCGVEVFIDALDECDDDEVRNIVRKFERSIDLARSFNGDFNVCWSSRHYPTISMRSQYGVEVTMEDNNQSDIDHFVKLELPTYLDPLLISVQEKIISKADGVFLWAVLVSQKMLKAVDQGKGEQQLHQLLESIPLKLEDLFDDIFGQIQSKSQERKELVCLAEWVLCAIRPLTLQELYLGLCSQVGKTSWSHRGGLPSREDLSRLQRWVNDVSRGLFEIKGALHGSNRVQVIHETVREYFLSPKGCSRLNVASRAVFRLSGHQNLAFACCQFFLQEEYDFRPTQEQHVSFQNSDLSALVTSPFNRPKDLMRDLYMQTYAFEHVFFLRHQYDGIPESTTLIPAGFLNHVLVNYLRLALDQGATEQTLPAGFVDNIRIVARYPAVFGVTEAEVIRATALIGNVREASALLGRDGVFLSPRGQIVELDSLRSGNIDEVVAVFCLIPRSAMALKLQLEGYLSSSETATDEEEVLREIKESQISLVLALRLVFWADMDRARKLREAIESFGQSFGSIALNWEVLSNIEVCNWSPNHRKLWQTMARGEICDLQSSVPICILFQQSSSTIDSCERRYESSASMTDGTTASPSSLNVNDEKLGLSYIDTMWKRTWDEIVKEEGDCKVPDTLDDLDRALALIDRYQIGSYRDLPGTPDLRARSDRNTAVPELRIFVGSELL